MGMFIDIHAHGYLEDQCHYVANGKKPFCNLDPGNLFNTEFRDRILFGVDICAPDGYVSPLDKTMKELLRTGRITASVYRKVARENHVRLLGL